MQLYFQFFHVIREQLFEASVITVVLVYANLWLQLHIGNDMLTETETESRLTGLF